VKALLFDYMAYKPVLEILKTEPETKIVSPEKTNL
jgi:hypothetical protein